MSVAGPVTHWTVQDVVFHLHGLPWVDPLFAVAAQQHRVDGRGLIALTKNDLLELGVSRVGDRQRLLQHFADLAEADPDAVEPAWALRELSPSPAAAVAALQTHSPRNWALGTGPTELPPVMSPRTTKMMTPRKVNTSAADLPDSLDRGSDTPFRGRELKKELARSLGLKAAAPAQSSVSRAFFSTEAHPSAPPRKSSKHKSDARLPLYRADKQLHESQAQQMRDIREKEERERQERKKQFIAQQEKDPVRRKLRAAFRYVDTDHSGNLSGQELESVLVMLFPTYGAERLRELHDAIMEECDKDKSGTIGVDEFCASMYAQELAQPAQQAHEREKRRLFLEMSFKKVDKDGSGQIDYNELRDLLQLVFPMLPQQQKEEYFQAIRTECDKNGDGVIAFDEFINSEYAMMLSRPAELDEERNRRRKKLEESFKQADPDGSGQLDHAELLQLLHNVFPNHSDEAIATFHEVIVTECDRDGSGSISIEEFTESKYANMLANIDEDVDRTFDERDATSGVLHVARQRRIKEKRMIENTANLRMTTMGTIQEGDTPPATPTRGQRAMEQLVGRPSSGKHSTNSSPRPNSGSPVPKHLATQEAERERVRAEQVADAQEIFLGVARGTLGYNMGIMEKERRFTMITDTFHRWDESSDVSQAGSGFIEYSELKLVLARFFNWADASADEQSDLLMRSLDFNTDGRLDWQEFVTFMTRLTDGVSPPQFDNLITYLHECIGDVSEELEYGRRDLLLLRLFRYWDVDESGHIESSELAMVIARYNELDRNEGDHFVQLTLKAVDNNSDGRLDSSEFCRYFQGLAYAFSPDEFDFLVFRVTRCVELVHITLSANRANIRYRLVMENHLAATELQNLLVRSRPSTPIVLYGTACDPARPIEKCAQYNTCEIFPHLITHAKAEKLALQSLRRRGFGRGHWIYLVLGEDYDADAFLRHIGVLLQTNSGTLQRKFRIWVWAPFPKVHKLPHVFLLDAVTLDLDAVQPPTNRAARLASVAAPPLFT